MDELGGGWCTALCRMDPSVAWLIYFSNRHRRAARADEIDGGSV
jgi:hypothetical protein